MHARQGVIGRDRVRTGVLGAEELDLRVLVARGVRRAARGLACVRVHAAEPAGQGQALARAGGSREELQRGARPIPRADGPLTANELGGAKKGGPWWDWSETKIAAEWLLDIGTLVCRERRGFQRVYDLAERAIPADLLSREWTDEECAERLAAAAGRSLGVATEADLATYHGLPRVLVRRALPATGLVPVSVEGWKPAAYADPDALAMLATRARGRSVLLSPFDSLIWYRERGPSACSACVTGSRPTRRRRSARTATSRCRCWRARRSSGWSTPDAMVRSSWPSRSRCCVTAPATRWRGRSSRRPPGSAARRSSLSGWGRHRRGGTWRMASRR